MPNRVLAAICFIFLVSATAGEARADAIADAHRALKMWEPTKIDKKQSTLIVIAKERRVTSKIYNAMIGAGLCAYAGTGRIKLDGVKEIVILNRFRATGWVFEGGMRECKRIANTPISKMHLHISGMTHQYACTSGRGCKY